MAAGTVPLRVFVATDSDLEAAQRQGGPSSVQVITKLGDNIMMATVSGNHTTGSGPWVDRTSTPLDFPRPREGNH